MKKFLSCDWGTSTFRLRLVNAETKEILDEMVSHQGIAETYQNWLSMGLPEAERIDFYRKIFLNPDSSGLRGAIQDFSNDIDPKTPIIVSGMASSTIGFQELPYKKMPFTWDIAQLPIAKIAPNASFSHPMYIVSGFRTQTDIMRGEETMLFGCDLQDIGEQIFIFPGTHSKHVFVKNKTAFDFKTYMTGEFFNLLATKSILAHSVADGDDPGAFEAGVKAAMTDNLLHNAFLVRTRQVLNQTSNTHNYAFLSGLLIGSELKNLPNDASICLVCSEKLQKQYKTALILRGMENEISYLNADEALVKGHALIADYFS